jgi:hypothetical protein
MEHVSDIPIEKDNINDKTQFTKRKYTKNINNPRWKNQKNLNHKDKNDLITSSDSDIDSITTNNTIDERISNSDSSEMSEHTVSSNNKISNNRILNKQQPVIEPIINYIKPPKRGRGRPKKVLKSIDNNKSQQHLDEQQIQITQYPDDDYVEPIKDKLTIENKDIARNCRYNLRSSNQKKGVG